MLKSKPATLVVPPPSWVVGTVSIPAGESRNLAPTLPLGTRLGGPFGLDAVSAPLPAGVTLSPLGVIAVAIGTPPITVSNVVFTYDEPAA